MAQDRRLETFFGPDNTAVIRPAPAEREARTSRESVKLVKANAGPDHVVYLMAKGRPLADWAAANLPAVAAERVKEFVRTRHNSLLATLTKHEMEQLRAQNVKLGTHLNI